MLLSKPGELDYDRHSLDVGEVVHAFPGDDPARAPEGILLTKRFGSAQIISLGKDGRLNLHAASPEMKGAYLDLRRIDSAGGVLTSYGEVRLRNAAPLRLIPETAKWHYFAVGEFNGDHRPDLLLAPYETQSPALEFLNTGDPAEPFGPEPTQRIPWPVPAKNAPPSGSLHRDTLAVADWNGDGYEDVFLAIGQEKSIHIIPGSAKGLDPARREIIPLEYHLHYETGLFVADFNHDGKPDIAALGYTETGVGTSGPMAVYIWCKP